MVLFIYLIELVPSSGSNACKEKKAQIQSVFSHIFINVMYDEQLIIMHFIKPNMRPKLIFSPNIKAVIHIFETGKQLAPHLKEYGHCRIDVSSHGLGYF